jgi:Cys-tRNA(Pro) deacylase
VARAATPAITALLAAEVPHEVLQYKHDPRSESFGEEAIEKLAGVDGVDPDQVFKTLVVALPKGLGVAVLPVRSKLSLKAAAAALGVAKATLADRAAAERSTGYIIGGISPLRSAQAAAHRRRRLGVALGPRAVQRRQARLGHRRTPAGPRQAHQRGHRGHPRLTVAECRLQARCQGPAGVT